MMSPEPSFLVGRYGEIDSAIDNLDNLSQQVQLPPLPPALSASLGNAGTCGTCAAGKYTATVGSDACVDCEGALSLAPSPSGLYRQRETCQSVQVVAWYKW